MTIIHITANSRLSATLKQQAIQTTALEGGTVAETPMVMTLAQWWQQWHESCLLRSELDVTDCNRKVLNRFESQWLWEQQILQQAWALSQEWFEFRFSLLYLQHIRVLEC